VNPYHVEVAVEVLMIWIHLMFLQSKAMMGPSRNVMVAVPALSGCFEDFKG
jgi:hypothetical protein